MERAAGGAHDASLQPSDTTEPAGYGGVQGGSVVPFFAGHFLFVHGMESRRATFETPKLSCAGCVYTPEGVESRGATATRPASLRVVYNT